MRNSDDFPHPNHPQKSAQKEEEMGGEKTCNTTDSLVIKAHLLVWPSLVYVWESGQGAEF